MKPQTKQLKEICTIAKGKKVKIVDKKTKDSIPYLLINTLRGKEPEFFTEDKRYTEAQEEDILMVFDGANSGLVGTGLKGAVGSTIGRIRLNKNILNKYVTYFLQSNFSFLNKDLKGSAIPHVKPSKMLELDLRLPEIKEQQQIVQAIETQFACLDEAIKSLKVVKQKIEIYRKAVLKKVFEKKDGWEESSVKDMGETVTGKTPKTAVQEYYGNEFCFFKPKDLDKGYFVNDSEAKLSKKGLEILKNLPEKSVMVTCIGATIGKTGLNRVEGATNQQINSIIINKSKFVPEFLYYLFISDLGQRSIIDNSSSTTLPILNKGRFEKLKFILPKSLQEQSQIVLQIESKFSVIDKVEQAVEQSLIKAEMLKKSILKVAFEGRLVKG